MYYRDMSNTDIYSYWLWTCNDGEKDYEEYIEEKEKSERWDRYCKLKKIKKLKRLDIKLRIPVFEPPF